MATRMVTGMAVVTVVVGSLLAGCQMAVSGTAGVSAADQRKADRRAEQQTAVEAALKALEAQPVAVYHSTLNGADLVIRVTNGGTVLGSLPAGGQPVQIVGVDNQLYLAASADYWKAHGSTSGEKYAKGWARADSAGLALNPATMLTPSGASRRLRAALAAEDQGADPVRGMLSDGTEVFQIEGSSGTLKVTTAQPYRLVSFAPGLLDGAVGQAFGTELRPDPVTTDTVKKFHEDLNVAVDGLGQPADSVAQVTLTVTDNKLDCNGGSGSCSSTVQVANSLVGADAKASTVHITMTSVVTADNLGTQTCTGDSSAAPNTTSSVVCMVKFKLPNRTAQYNVVSVPSATGDVIASLDTGAVKQKIQSEFAAIGG